MLTQKKRLYAEARLSGLNMTDSAIAAGCPEKTAQPAGSRYEKDADVIAYIERAKAPKPAEPEPIAAVQAPAPPTEQPKMPLRFEDPLEFLRHVTNDSAEDPRLRLDAAKAWASYTVPKPGEKGKKEEKADAAKKVAGRFSAAQAPIRMVK
jgi:phage terminase small subunit